MFELSINFDRRLCIELQTNIIRIASEAFPDVWFRFNHWFCIIKCWNFLLIMFQTVVLVSMILVSFASLWSFLRNRYTIAAKKYVRKLKYRQNGETSLKPSKPRRLEKGKKMFGVNLTLSYCSKSIQVLRINANQFRSLIIGIGKFYFAITLLSLLRMTSRRLFGGLSHLHVWFRFLGAFHIWRSATRQHSVVNNSKAIRGFLRIILCLAAYFPWSSALKCEMRLGH